MNIKVGQHIYGNLEKEVSPRKISGFQTIAYTSEMLGEIESGEIEKRLVYNYSEIEPVKMMFFRLANNKYVISRLIPLPDLDRFGRKGLYLAQSFIFSLEDFVQLNYNPFTALKLLRLYFIKSNIEALKLANSGESNIIYLNLEANNDVFNPLDIEILNEVQNWNTEELKKLAFTALNCAKYKFEKKSIALIGKPENIENTLNVALSLIPNKNRLDCSFDTYAPGCNPVANYFWAFGYPAVPPGSQAFIAVDAVQRAIKLNTYSSDSCYERWLFSNITSRKFTEIFTRKALASELQNLLLGAQVDNNLLQSVSEGFLQEFFVINWSFVIKSFNATLSKTLGINLGLSIQDRAFRHCQNLDPRQLLIVLIGGLSMQVLAEELYQVFKNRKPSDGELNELGNFIKVNKHDLLAIHYYYWKKNGAQLQSLLDGLDEKTYLEVIELLIKHNHFPLSNFITSPRAGLAVGTFSTLASKNSFLIIQVPQIFKTLFTLHQDAHLQMLIPLLGDLNLQQLKEIEKEEGKAFQTTSKAFFKSVKDTLAAKEKEEKSKNSISGLFNKVFKK